MKVQIRYEKQKFDVKKPAEYVEVEASDGEVVSMIEADYRQRRDMAQSLELVQRRSIEEIVREEINKPEYNQAKQWVRNTDSCWRVPLAGGGNIFDELVDQYGHMKAFDDPFDDVDTRLTVESALAGLDERERFIVIQNRLNQVPLTVVAAELGITQPRASQLLKSARAKIAAEIGLKL